MGRGTGAAVSGRPGGKKLQVQGFETDRLKTSRGDLGITLLGHGSLLFSYGGKNTYVDPFSRVAESTDLPCDLIRDVE